MQFSLFTMTQKSVFFMLLLKHSEMRASPSPSTVYFTLVYFFSIVWLCYLADLAITK